MMGIFNTRFALTDTTDRLGVLLTLLFFATFPIHGHCAIDTNNTFAYSSRNNNTIDVTEENARRDALVDFARKQAISLAPGLPDEIRSTVRDALEGFQTTRGFLNLDVKALDNDTSEQSPADPLAPLKQSITQDKAESPWVASTTYHHRHGILPTHDALVVGTHMHQDYFDHYMSFDAHPYFGQNYFSAKNYYGAEFKLDFAKPDDTAHAKKPWGSISFNYTNGDDKLMDHGRGVDMHTEIYFNENLTLNSGLRQSDASGTGNYVMLQWKLAIH